MILILLYESIYTIKKNTKALLVVSEEFVLGVIVEKTVYVPHS
jgi:hypothetical protein